MLIIYDEELSLRLKFQQWGGEISVRYENKKSFLGAGAHLSELLLFCLILLQACAKRFNVLCDQVTGRGGSMRYIAGWGGDSMNECI